MNVLASILLATALLLLLQQCQSEMTTVPLPSNVQCGSPSQVFDYAGLVCADCDSSKIQTGMCGCPSTSLQTDVDCSIESMWQGTCKEVTCTTECSTLSQAASLDRKYCTPCDSTEASTLERSSKYDDVLDDCTCNNPAKASPTGTYVVTQKLVEIYNETGLPIRKDCLRCPKGTAVITKDLYEGDGQKFFTAAGREYTADPYSCVSCPDPHMFFDTDYSCACADGYLLTGEASIGEQSCIKNNPSISSSYSRVRFQDPFAFELDYPYDFTLESITFSHLYLNAASECEYFKGTSEKSLRSCQTLGNLCVMNMYDEDMPACRQIEMISQRRIETYHNQEEWKRTLPWLYYRDEADYITSDRGINMRISFHAEVDHVNILSFKLAKFTVDGEFVGIEDLADQFEFCSDRVGNDDRKKPHWLTFGSSFRREYECSVESLISKEMFLYDLYGVDESLDSCSGVSGQSDCLYPVPVLNRNLVKDNKFPNANRQLGEELDDIYTRRFFLFDNQSGRTSSGVEAIRYANKIVLQIQTQSENPNNIYPPQLVIEYATSANGNWFADSKKKDANTSLLFKVEYSMKTENFWASIQIMIGFIFAFGLVVFGVRMNNFFTRQRSNSDDPNFAGSVPGHFIFHGFIIACHTFAMLFFSFNTIVCAYWFIFFKGQSEVFLLLPSDNEFHGVTNEYYFFECSLQALFWCQSVYLTYIIIQQCRSDIIFIDWERRRGKSNNGVPMWRLVMVANEFHRMQAKRRISIEFSLILIAFFMIGVDQHNNASPQPNFDYSGNEDSNIALSFANTVLYFVVVWVVQLAWRFFIYERWVEEPYATRFLDLCTVCNISVLIMVENNKGYYLHGKSPYESADCSMDVLLDNLQREGHGFTINRGLDGSPSGCQTFIVYGSSVFRRQISKIYNCVRPMQGHFFSRSNDQTIESREKDITLARRQLQLFLQRFIEQQPSPTRDGLKYIVREPLIAERVFNVTPADFRTNVESKCILHPDDNGYLSATFLGIELDLFIHDILTYNVANMAFENPGISIFFTYLVHLFRTQVRLWFGRKNLSDKSFIDAKFLG